MTLDGRAGSSSKRPFAALKSDEIAKAKCSSRKDFDGHKVLHWCVESVV